MEFSHLEFEPENKSGVLSSGGLAPLLVPYRRNSLGLPKLRSAPGGEICGGQKWPFPTLLLAIQQPPPVPWGTAFQNAAWCGIYFLFMECLCAHANLAGTVTQKGPFLSLSSTEDNARCWSFPAPRTDVIVKALSSLEIFISTFRGGK